MIVLAGKTCSGKNLVASKLSELGYRQIITYTTRPKRENEIQDEAYHFITEDDFKNKISEDFFAEYKTYDTQFGTWYYGTSLADIENAENKSIVILTPQGYRDVKNKLLNKDITTIYLCADENTLKSRLLQRGDNPKEAERRLKQDREDFNGFEDEADILVYNNADLSIETVINTIKEALQYIYE